jgi:lysophospholipase L1-like esterase
VLFVGLLLAIEFAVRATLPPLSGVEVLVRDPVQRAGFGDRRAVSIFEADPLLLWRLRPGLRDVIWDFTPVSTDSGGLRRASEPVAAVADVVRVLALGDSVTFGYRVPVVWPERPQAYDRAAHPWPALLEQALRAANPGRAIEVLPLAVPGYTSHQGRLWLEREIDRLRPALVVALYGWNDSNLRPVADADAMPAGGPTVWARGLALRSQALLRLAGWAREGGGAATAPRWRVEPAAFAANHRAMAALAAGVGARFAAIAPVYGDAVALPGEAPRIEALRVALRGAAREARFPLLEVPELTEAAHPGNQWLFGETIHPSHLGHRLLTERLMALLDRERLLEGVHLRSATTDPSVTVDQLARATSEAR